MQTALIIVGVVAAIIVIILILAMFQPKETRTERTATIKAPADKIFPWINDLHKWQSWSPFEKLDPKLNRKFSGAPSGLGAIYEWQGNMKSGAGRMEIIESRPSSKVKIDLQFLKPIKCCHTAEFTLTPSGDSTQVTWAMYGPNIFMSKVMGLFMNTSDMVGKEFATGLESIKKLTES